MTRPRPKQPDPGFPLRAAAVDVGSNAIRFLAAEFSAPRSYRVLAGDRVPVRLGHGVFTDGRIGAGAMDAAVAALAGFRRKMDALEVAAYRAVATSATRESTNSGDFVDRVRREAGLELEVISGEEEARVGFEAVRSRVRLGEDRWLLVDLGGGSVETSLVDATGILWSESVALGSVRLLEEARAFAGDPGRLMERVRRHAAALRLPDQIREAQRGVIATGGNIEALARLTGHYPPGPARLPVPALHEAITLLASLTVPERIERLGLKPDRADVVLPGALVYAHVAALAGADAIVVPGVGLKEGLLVDLVHRREGRVV